MPIGQKLVLKYIDCNTRNEIVIINNKVIFFFMQKKKSKYIYPSLKNTKKFIE